MSATSGNALIDLLGAGTATLASQLWTVVGLDATTQTTAAALSGGLFAAAAAGNVVVASTGTAMSARLNGMLTTSAGGTLIPSIGLTDGQRRGGQGRLVLPHLPGGCVER
jgi:hypothetical protein